MTELKKNQNNLNESAAAGSARAHSHNVSAEEVIYELTHGKAVYILAFVVPLIIIVTVFMLKKIYPFGDYCYLRSDMYHQYCPFFSELWEKLKTGGSLTYTWDVGMGTNFTAIIGYYLSSPSNWFIALFPQKSMIEIMNVIIMLKLAGASLSMTVFLVQHTGKRSIVATMIGMFYGLSAFAAAYAWNLMWLDCVLLFPLIVLGLEKLVKSGKGLLYSITLGFAILSNYYIAIMICIGLVLYFIVAFVCLPGEERTLVNCCKAVLRFALYSVLAALFACILLLPEVFALGYTASSNINFPDTLSRYFSFITMISRHLINVKVELGLSHLPNIYCGVGVFILFPLYIMTKNIPVRQRIAKVAFVIIMLLAFNLNIPNFIWHGFHFPNSLPCRESFIYIFILLAVCHEALINYKQWTKKDIAVSFWCIAMLMLYIGHSVITDDSTITFTSLYVTLAFVVIYFTMMLIVRKSRKSATYILLPLYLVSIGECLANMNTTGYGVTGRSNYLKDYDNVATLLDSASEIEGENSFYRVTKFRGYRSKNDAAWHNFHGASTFSSTSYAALTDFYDIVGLEHSFNAYAINGATPVVYSLFGIKYLLSNEAIGGSLYTLAETAYDEASTSTEFLYSNAGAAAIAYAGRSRFLTDFNLNETDPFKAQNDWVESLTGITGIFEPIYYTDNGDSAVYVADEDLYLYMYCTNTSVETINVTTSNGTSSTYTGINHGRTVDLGFITSGTTVTAVDSSNDKKNVPMLMYQLNIDKYNELCEYLSNNNYIVTSYSDTSISGNISLEKGQMLVTTIPYDKGWTMYVNGVETPYTYYGNEAFIAAYLDPGDYTIEFKYVPGGLKAGIICTIAAIIVWGLMIFFRICVGKEITEDGAIDILFIKKKSEPDDDEPIEGTGKPNEGDTESEDKE